MSHAATLGILACLIVSGAILIVWSMPLSLRYNAWTTSIRERHNRPPTPEMRQLNTKIMARLFRILGFSLALLATFAAVAARLF